MPNRGLPTDDRAEKSEPSGYIPSWVKLIAKLPWPLVFGASTVLAYLLRVIVRYRRKVIDENLSQSVPDASVSELRELRRRFYSNLTDVMVETLKSASLSREELRERIQFKDTAALESYLHQQQPVIVVGAHHHNWEWVALGCSVTLPTGLEVIYRPLHNQWFEDLMLGIRTAHGARLVSDSDAFRTIISKAKETRIVSFAADQRPASKGPRVWVHFLNRDTPFFAGWAKIAMATRYPVFFADRVRTDRGHYEVTLIELEANNPQKSSDSLVTAYANALEIAIVRDPHAWLWSHRRWRKKDPLYR